MTRENLLTRDDTFFGVCAGLAEDLGFDPMWLRVPLGISILWNPTAAAAVYLAMALVVGASRLLFPAPRTAAGEVSGVEALAEKTETLPIAA
jgi:phage shock protein PspC (stress-responsive transcriptional regulator)